MNESAEPFTYLLSKGNTSLLALSFSGNNALSFRGNSSAGSRIIDFTFNNDINDGEWHTLVINIRQLANNTEEGVMYLDGFANNEGYQQEDFFGDTGFTDIGYDGTRTFDGSLSFLGVYNKNLTQSEIEEFSQSHSLPSDSAVIRKYVFSEGAGTVVYDLSGSNNHGQVINPVLPGIWGTQDVYHYSFFNGFHPYISTRLPYNYRKCLQGNGVWFIDFGTSPDAILVNGVNPGWSLASQVVIPDGYVVYNLEVTRGSDVALYRCIEGTGRRIHRSDDIQSHEYLTLGGYANSITNNMWHYQWNEEIPVDGYISCIQNINDPGSNVNLVLSEDIRSSAFTYTCYWLHEPSDNATATPLVLLSNYVGGLGLIIRVNGANNRLEIQHNSQPYAWGATDWFLNKLEEIYRFDIDSDGSTYTKVVVTRLSTGEVDTVTWNGVTTGGGGDVGLSQLIQTDANNQGTGWFLYANWNGVRLNFADYSLGNYWGTGYFQQHNWQSKYVLDNTLKNCISNFESGYHKTGAYNGASDIQFPDVPEVPENLRGKTLSKNELAAATKSSRFLSSNNRGEILIHNQELSVLEQKREGMDKFIFESISRSEFEFMYDLENAYFGDDGLLRVKDAINLSSDLIFYNDAELQDQRIYFPGDTDYGKAAVNLVTGDSFTLFLLVNRDVGHVSDVEFLWNAANGSSPFIHVVGDIFRFYTSNGVFTQNGSILNGSGLVSLALTYDGISTVKMFGNQGKFVNSNHAGVFSASSQIIINNNTALQDRGSIGSGFSSLSYVNKALSEIDVKNILNEFRLKRNASILPY
ncbi:MAG: hypothetical protein Roseis3KO_49200 [Roseivirga sp.]